MIPFQVMLAPLFTLVNGFGLINTYVGIILPYLAFGVPYQVFILHGFFSEVPKELSEAALIDGASHFTIFRRIFLPVSLPVLAALLILDFVATWNEFAMALVILQDNAHVDAAARPDVVPEPVPARLRPAQLRDRDDRAPGRRSSTSSSSATSSRASPPARSRNSSKGLAMPTPDHREVGHFRGAL